MSQIRQLFPLKVDTISPSLKIIRGGRNLPAPKAVETAFPEATGVETFGFRWEGNDLQIRKINFL